jgi:hypothetical protein
MPEDDLKERSKYIALTSSPISQVVDTVVSGSFEFKYLLYWLFHFIFFSSTFRNLFPAVVPVYNIRRVF